METPVFFLFCFAVGYLMYWTAVNDKRDPHKGEGGWFAIKPPKERGPQPGREPWSRDTRR